MPFTLLLGCFRGGALAPDFFKVADVNVEPIVDFNELAPWTLNPHATIMSKHVGSDGFH